MTGAHMETALIAMAWSIVGLSIATIVVFIAMAIAIVSDIFDLF